ncbi:MAG: hypothetical protein EOO91_02665 [Pedobacter sp.]|nr:MAG: hypothetical protein EOO91_02665 [Pedobacter sp.]
MAIITLTTDLGSKDFYQAALKGSILNILPTANIVDITHEVPSFNISYAAFVLKNAYPYFPKNTVHLIGIDSVFSENTKYISLRYKDHYFVGADNGIFSLLLDEAPDELVELNIGSVIYIDTFCNVITNITKDLFTKIQRNRDFTLYFRKSETITQLSWHYNEVPEGEKLCLFGISNHLEIAINKGKASGLLGLHLSDIVRVEFHP